MKHNVLSKDQLTEKRTTVRLTVDPLTIPAIANALNGFGPIPSHDLRRDTYVVKDLFDRKNFNKPDEIGIGPADRGIAFAVRLDEITLADVIAE